MMSIVFFLLMAVVLTFSVRVRQRARRKILLFSLLLELLCFSLQPTSAATDTTEIMDSDFERSYYTQINTDWNVWAVAQTSNDTLYAAKDLGTSRELWKSADQGSTWTKESAFPEQYILHKSLWVASNDDVWCQAADSTLYVKSAATGAWSKSFENCGIGIAAEPWYFAYSTTSGSYFFCRYASAGMNDAEGCAIRRLKAGVWQWVLNVSDYESDYVTGVCHCQGLIVSDSNGWVYTSLDTTDNSYIYNNIMLSKNDGDTWISIWNKTTDINSHRYTRFTAMWQDSSYIYFGGDFSVTVRLAKSDENWAHRQEVFTDVPADRMSKASNTYVYNAWYYPSRGLHLAIDYSSKLWASKNGEDWASIYYDNSIATASANTLTRYGTSIYFTEVHGRLYRLNYPVNGDEAAHLYRAASSANTTLTVGSGVPATLSFGQKIISNPTITLIGNSRQNLVLNSGFEGTVTGNPPYQTVSSWTFGGGVKRGVSTSVFEGTKALNCTVETGLGFNVYQEIFASSKMPLITFYARSREAQNNKWALNVQYSNGNGTWFQAGKLRYNTTTSWMRMKFPVFRVPDFADRLRLYFSAPTISGGTNFQLDAVQLEFADFGNNMPYKTQHIYNYTAFSYSTNILNTTDPSVTINGQTFSYSGALANGQRATGQTYSGYLFGIVDLSATVTGSMEVDVEITGTVVLAATNVFIQERAFDVYIGRYIETPSITQNSENALVCCTSLNSTIVLNSYSGIKLNFTVTASSSSAGTTKVYVGDRGQPRNVSGASSWSYDSEMEILTITTLHPGSAVIIVSWNLQGDINNDGRVDASDLILLREAFGSTGGPPPDTNWNPEADISKDNRVNVVDLHMLGKRYGETNP